MLIWPQSPAENTHVRIGAEAYYLSSDGRLMPTRKDQPPPDLEFFALAQKQFSA